MPMKLFMLFLSLLGKLRVGLWFIRPITRCLMVPRELHPHSLNKECRSADENNHNISLMRLFHFSFLPQTPGLTVMLPETLKPIYSSQKMTFSNPERKFSSYSSSVLLLFGYDQYTKKKTETHMSRCPDQRTIKTNNTEIKKYQIS